MGASGPTQLATIVADRSDLRELQHQRAGRAARARRDQAARPHAGGSQEGAGRGRPAEREGYPHKGTLDYAAPTVSQSTGTLAVRGDPAPIPTGCCCRDISCACACREQPQQCLARAGRGARQRPGRTLRARRRQGQRRRAAQGHDRPAGRRAAGDRQRPRRPTIASSSPASCARSRARRSIRSCRRPRLPRRPLAPSSGGRHDLEFLHRAAGSGERARHPDDRGRRRRAARAAGRAVSRRGAADRAGHARAIPAPARAPSSTPSRCRSSSRSTASRA